MAWAESNALDRLDLRAKDDWWRGYDSRSQHRVWGQRRVRWKEGVEGKSVTAGEGGGGGGEGCREEENTYRFFFLYLRFVIHVEICGETESFLAFVMSEEGRGGRILGGGGGSRCLYVGDCVEHNRYSVVSSQSG